MVLSTSLSRRQFTRTMAGVTLGTLVAGCSGGTDSSDDGDGDGSDSGGCGNPAVDAAPRDLLPKAGGGFERVNVSDDSLQDVGETGILGAYSGTDARYSVIIYRFADEEGATNYEQRLVRAARIQNESAYAVFTLQNFVFTVMVENEGSGTEARSQAKQLLGRSPVVSASCVTKRNALSDDLLPETPA